MTQGFQLLSCFLFPLFNSKFGLAFDFFWMTKTFVLLSVSFFLSHKPEEMRLTF
jgi:hypothetical protein